MELGNQRASGNIEDRRGMGIGGGLGVGGIVIALVLSFIIRETGARRADAAENPLVTAGHVKS